MSTSSQHASPASPSSPRAVDTFGSRRPLVALCVGYVMIMMDATVVNTALPDISRDLSATVSGLQWVVDGYTLIFACLLLSAGSFGDRLGARRVFLTGLALFTIASIACGLAPTIGVLNGARVAQGIGAALALPTSLVLIKASYLDRASRARAIGLWGGLSGAGAGFGPVLGGIVTSWVGWRAIFFINVPIGIAGIVLTLRYVVATPAKTRIGLDPLGQLLAIITVAALAYGLIDGGAQSWLALPVLAAFAIAVACGTGFVIAERLHRNPMLPLGLFASHEFTGSILVGAAMNLGFYGELFLLSLYFQQVRHFSPLLAGLALLPQPGVVSLAAVLGGRHTARFGPRAVMVIGLSIGAVGLLAMTLSGVATPYWMLIAPLMAIGFGTTYTMPGATAAVIEAAPSDQTGIASGALNSSRQIGSTLGVAVFGALLASTAFMTAYHISVLIGGLVFVSGALIALLAVPRHHPIPT